MVRCPMADQRTISAVRAGADKFKSAIRRRSYVIPVEINKPGLAFYSVRVVTRTARCLLVHDMKPMTAILALRVCGVEALVVQNAGPVVAFIAEGVLGNILGVAVGQDELPFEQRNINGTVRPVGPRAAGIGSLVIVMAIGAIHPA